MHSVYVLFCSLYFVSDGEIMEFFDLDKQISNIVLKSLGITENQTIDNGLIGWLNDQGVLGAGALENEYVNSVLPDLYILFYAVALFVVSAGVLFYILYLIGPLSAYGYVVIMEVVSRTVMGSVAVACAAWILRWLVELSDAITLMFGVNSDIMVFVVDMFTSAYSCVFVILGTIGIYNTAFIYVIRAHIIAGANLIFIIAVIFWIMGAIESPICKNIESLGIQLIRLLLWGLFLTPVMAICYGVGMGVMMSGTDPGVIQMFIGISILFTACLVPLLLFFKFVYNPVTPIMKGVYMAGRFL